MITSRDNPAVRQYTLLASSRKARMESGLFVTEGEKLTLEAASVCKLKALYVTERAAAKYDLACLGSPVFVSEQVAKRLASAVTPQGVFAVFERPLPRFAALSAAGRYLLLDGLQDPGNVGTILRTAAALGVLNVFLSPACPDPYGLKVLRASMGGVFRLALETREPKQAIAALREAGVQVWAAALDSHAVSPKKAGLGAGCAVVVGNEGNGLTPECVAQCGGTVMIPMAPGNESLNAAMAAGILLWEMVR